MGDLEIWSSQVLVYVNGVRCVEKCARADETLLSFLRRRGWTGTKLGCGEGGCGACTVMVSHYDHETSRVVHRSVNACLAPLCACDGCHVTTVEGIGSSLRMHPVQERLWKAHGAQCGFCTPGFVMAMYTVLRNNPKPTRKEIEHSLDGNLCRCTGYRPIFDAFLSFAASEAGADAAATAAAAPAPAAAGADAPGCACGAAGGCCRAGNATASENTPDTPKEAGEGVQDEEYDPAREPIFPPALKKHVFGPLRVEHEGYVWIRPASLEQLVNVRCEHGDACKFVVGNTELGIDLKYRHADYRVYVTTSHVPELTCVARTERAGRAGLEVGAAVTLTRFWEALRGTRAALADEGKAHAARVLTAYEENLQWFASTQIRNVAALGGNIVTASPISDLNPIHVAAGAVFILAGPNGAAREVAARDFFLAYRKVDLRADEVLKSVFIPFSREHEYIAAYKQARRREDDIAIVNACFNVLLTPASSADAAPVVAEAAIAYGGMAPRTVSAPKTEKLLTGASWTSELVEKALDSIAEDVPLPPNAPGGMVEFRRSLAASFFFKFFLRVQAAIGAAIDERERSAVEPAKTAERTAVQCHGDLCPAAGPQPVKLAAEAPDGDDDSAGVATSTAVTAESGKPVAHAAGKLHVTGEAVYTDDERDPAQCVHAALVMSAKAHAEIVDVDASDALGVDGVLAYVDASAVHGSNELGAVIIDEEVFATKEVHSVGQVIGVIVAESARTARRAARMVVVTYRELPAILSIADAEAAGSFYDDFERKLERGDVDAAFAAAAHVVEGEARIGGQEHFYLEPHTTLAIPQEGGGMEIICSTQNPTKTQRFAASALGVPANRVVCRCRRMGGGFGGKETRNVFLSSACSVAAAHVRRPCRLTLDRDEDMAITGGRHPFVFRYRAAAAADGTLLALDAELMSNGGCSLDLSGAVLERALFHAENAYRIDAVRLRGRVCRTNLPSNTAFRGFGGPQGMFLAECVVDHIAAATGVRADAVRSQSLYREGDVTPYGQPLEQCRSRALWQQTIDDAAYDQRRTAADAFNAAHKWRKRGLAAVPVKFGMSFTAKFMNQAGALVHCYTDGTVLVSHGGTEMGQGLHTKIAQIAADALRVPLDAVHIAETSTDKVPNTSPTAASVSSDMNGQAVLLACEQISARLAPVRARLGDGATFADICQAAHFDRISLSAAGFYRTPDIGFDWSTCTGKPFFYFAYGTAVAEVEVDTLTGDARVLRADVCHDVGRSLSPAIDIGQVEGAFVQGMGLFALEEHVRTPQGQLFTRGPGTYKIPSADDVPLDLRVSLMKNAANPRVVGSSKGVGEPPFFLAASVFFAIKDAVYAARREHGHTGHFVLDSPASAERIRMACADAFTRHAAGEAHAAFRANGDW